ALSLRDRKAAASPIWGSVRDSGTAALLSRSERATCLSRSEIRYPHHGVGDAVFLRSGCAGAFGARRTRARAKLAAPLLRALPRALPRTGPSDSPLSRTVSRVAGGHAAHASRARAVLRARHVAGARGGSPARQRQGDSRAGDGAAHAHGACGPPSRFAA